jgi:hypothetical protein
MSSVLQAMPETLPLPLDVPREAWPALIDRAAGELKASTLLDPWPNASVLALSVELRSIAAQLRLLNRETTVAREAVVTTFGGYVRGAP